MIVNTPPLPVSISTNEKAGYGTTSPTVMVNLWDIKIQCNLLPWRLPSSTVVLTLDMLEDTENEERHQQPKVQKHGLSLLIDVFKIVRGINLQPKRTRFYNECHYWKAPNWLPTSNQLGVMVNTMLTDIIQPEYGAIKSKNKLFHDLLC